MPDERSVVAVLGVGASFGLGATLARRFARGGFDVIIGGRRADNLQAVAGEIGSLGGGACEAIPVDVTEPDSVDQFFTALDSLNQKAPAAVIYNAGNNQRIPLLELTPDSFEDFWRVCCYGGLLVGQAALRRLLPVGKGSILFTGASGSRRGRPGFAHFAAGKAGLKMLAESMAREFGPKGIHVSHVIIDGGIDGERIHSRFPERAAAAGEHGLLDLEAIAEQFWQLHHQHPSAWTFETELRPYKESW